MKLVIAVIIAVVVILSATAFLVLQQPGSPATESELAKVTEPKSVAPFQAPEILPAEALVTPTEPDVSKSPEPAEPVQSSPVSKERSLRIRVRVTGVDPSIPLSTPIQLRVALAGSARLGLGDLHPLELAKEIEEAERSAGSFERTATPRGVALFELRDSKAAKLGSTATITIDDPAYMPWQKRIWIRAPQTPPLEYSLKAPLQLAGSITGLVQSSGNHPQGIMVALYPANSGAPSRKPVSTTLTDARGAYELRSPKTGDHLVLAYEKDARPAAVKTFVRLKETGNGPTLATQPGASIAGEVTSRTKRPVAGAELRLVRLDESEHVLDLGPAQFSWNGLSAVIQRDLIETDSLGRFAHSGLDLGTRYAVKLPTGAGRRQRAVTKAPAQDLELQTDDVRLFVEVWGRGQPLQSAEVIIQGAGVSLQGTTSRYGQFQQFLAANNRYELSVQADGFQSLNSSSFSLNGASEQLQVVKLEPLAGSLKIFLEAGGNPVRSAKFHLQHESELTLQRELESPSGTYEFLDLEPGHYQVRVEFDESGTGPQYYLPRSTETRVEIGQQTELRIPITEGGHIKLFLRERNGGRTPVVCRLYDERDQVIETELRATGSPAQLTTGTGPGPTSNTGPVSSPELTTNTELFTASPIIPQRTLLRVSSKRGSASAEEWIDVEPGTTTEVALTLEGS